MPSPYSRPLFSDSAAPYFLFDLIQQLPAEQRGQSTGDINALSTVCCDAAGDEIIVVSFRQWGLVAAFQRDPPFTHQWSFGTGQHSDFRMVPPLAQGASGGMFAEQHHAHLLPNAPVEGSQLGSGGLEAGVFRLLVYDNGGEFAGDRNFSRGMEFELDTRLPTAAGAYRHAHLVWQYKTGYSLNRGSAYRVPPPAADAFDAADGDDGASPRTLVGCPHCGDSVMFADRTSAGAMFEVDETGAEVARIALPPLAFLGGYSPFYRAMPVPTLGGERRIARALADEYFGARDLDDDDDDDDDDDSSGDDDSGGSPPACVRDCRRRSPRACAEACDGSCDFSGCLDEDVALLLNMCGTAGHSVEEMCALQDYTAPGAAPATPSSSPSPSPSAAPSSAPAPAPAPAPTASPSAAPSSVPVPAPTVSPTAAPSSSLPAPTPTASSFAAPSSAPALTPTASSFAAPSFAPAPAPTASPFAAPTSAPASAPTTALALGGQTPPSPPQHHGTRAGGSDPPSPARGVARR